jgi:hypothetical protein
LKSENEKLKKWVEENNIDEEKLKIFKNCMTRFLEDTNEKITTSIET